MKYVEIDTTTKAVLVEAQEQLFIPDLSSIGRECIDVTDLTTLPKAGWIYDENTKVFSKPLESELTTDEKIANIRQQYDDAVKTVCTDNMLNDINSARNLATANTSLLNAVSVKITAWELVQQNKFVNLLAQVQSGTLDIDSVVFSDEFTDFVANDW